MRTSFIYIFLVIFSLRADASILDSCKESFKSILVIDRIYKGHQLKSLKVGENYSKSRIGFLVKENSRLIKGQNKKLNSIIQDLEKLGGELRILAVSKGSKPILRQKHLSYFRVTDDGKPIVAIEHASGWDKLMHQYCHFKDWKAARKKFIQEGMDQQKASLAAKDLLQSSQYLWRSELNAIKAELAVSKPKIFSTNYLRRKIYPELITIERIFDQKTISLENRQSLQHLTKKAIMKSLLILYTKEKSSRKKMPDVITFYRSLGRTKLKLKMGIYSYSYELETLFDNELRNFLRLNPLPY